MVSSFPKSAEARTIRTSLPKS
ncbi:hypothetical protein D039_1668A, partial [Vibrio parahaemolyticus EKP-028]